MLRFILAAGVFIAVLALDVRPAPAGEGPWCAVASAGPDGVSWDCRYGSIEECRPNVIAGNRGFCTQNPRWVDVEPVRRRPKRRAERH
jgi:hypothetical protein